MCIAVFAGIKNSNLAATAGRGLGRKMCMDFLGIREGDKVGGKRENERYE